MGGVVAVLQDFSMGQLLRFELYFELNFLHGTYTERDDLQGEEGLQSLAAPLQPKPQGLLNPYLGWEYMRGIELASP